MWFCTSTALLHSINTAPQCTHLPVHTVQMVSWVNTPCFLHMLGRIQPLDFLIYIARNSHASHVRNVQGLHYLSSRCSMEINGCQKWQRQKSERNSELLISVCSRTLSQDCKYSCMLCFLLLQTQGTATTINKRLLQEASRLK